MSHCPVITFRRSRAADHDFLIALQESLEPRSVPHELAEKEFADRAAVLDRAYPNADDEIICEDGVPAGRMVISRRGDELWLLDISLVESARGRGIGSIVVGNLIERCRKSRILLRLHVETANRRAHTFYARLGFERVDCDAMYDEMVWRPD